MTIKKILTNINNGKYKTKQDAFRAIGMSKGLSNKDDIKLRESVEEYFQRKHNFANPSKDIPIFSENKFLGASRLYLIVGTQAKKHGITIHEMCVAIIGYDRMIKYIESNPNLGIDK